MALLHLLEAKAALASLEHRGPDDTQLLHSAKCWLGHTRLAIVDEESGAQPMVRNGVSITYNGELYNASQLRKRLIASGFFFDTHSDTEVVLASYLVWGSDCVKQFDGMFAFAINDAPNGIIFFARDRFGKKPLYFMHEGGTLFIASEIKALRKFSAFDGEIDLSQVDHFLARMHVHPNSSIFKKVQVLPPASLAIYHRDTIKIERYWELPNKPLVCSRDEAKEEIRRLLADAVKKRLSNCDQEIGLFLSGGVDSSLIAIATSANLTGNTRAFSVDYSGDRSEYSYAQELSETIGLSLSRVELGTPSIDDFDLVISALDEPHADSSNLAQFLVSKRAAEHVKVVLSGDGADEVFMGYPWHLRMFREDHKDPLRTRIENICVFDREQRETLWGGLSPPPLGSLFAYTGANKQHSLRQVMDFDIGIHLPGQILTKVDRASMAYGLEVRSPFLDTDLVSFASNLHMAANLSEICNKMILRELLEEQTSTEFAFREKQGFGAPQMVWLKDREMFGAIAQRLGVGAKIRSMFASQMIDRVVQDCRVAKLDDFRAGQRLWSLYCLERWLSLA